MSTATDPAGSRKLSKAKSRSRVDGMVSLAMAVAMAAEASLQSEYVSGGLVAL